MLVVLTTALVIACSPLLSSASDPLQLEWRDEMLSIHHARLPGGEVQVWYIEAFCRAGSTDRDWRETVIRHRTELIDRSDDGTRIELRSDLTDGVIVNHIITCTDDDVTFRLRAHNPTDRSSEVHWGQPCLRVDKFTGREQADYLPQAFIFVDDKLQRLPVEPWATEARYTPGQVWCPRHVDRDDVNPRPLSEIVPSNGLIGCFSRDGSQILAMACEPYQELFQGVIVCLHADFRIGGLEPAETRHVRGKIYLRPDNDVEALLHRYERDFPEHHSP